MNARTTDSISLLARGPARWGPVQAFFAMRAIPGLESVTESGFRRNVPGGWIELSGDDHHVRLGYSLDDPTQLEELVAVARRVGDLDTDLDPIEEHLREDPVLADRLDSTAVGRVPGPFDRFEVAVRAVIGQQISVAGARTLLGRLITETGGEIKPASEPEDRSADPPAETGGEAGDQAEPKPNTEPPTPTYERFPSPATVAESPLDLGMPERRRATIRALATAIADGAVRLDDDTDPVEATDQLLAIPGIGPWTAGYIAMRALGDQDGWPSGDLGLRRSLGIDGAELEHRSERWRPWRAYAAVLLWQTDPTTTSPTTTSTADDGNPKEKR